MHSHLNRSFRYFCWILLSLVSLPLAAETWSDASGEFAVEAKFMGVEGKSIVLLKPDGKKITVPIAKLSTGSRTQAKALYQLQMKELAQPTTQLEGNVTGIAHSQRSLNFQPPTPPATEPMPTFPEGISLQQTVDFTNAQLRAGHPSVLWYMLPSEMRATFDDPGLRTAISPFVERQGGIVRSARTTRVQGR